MSTQDPPDAAAPGTDPPDQPAVIDLQQVRAQRREQEQATAAAQDEARRRQFAGEHDWHRRVLEYVIASGRLPFRIFTNLVRLGLVTDDPGRLPCEAHERRTDPGSWEYQEWSQDVDDPEADLIDGLVAELRARGVTLTGSLQEITAVHQRKIPPPNTVCCPLTYYPKDTDPPCAHALRNRVVYRSERDRLVATPVPPDPDDVVLRSGLCPCLFLGREIFRAVMPGVWKLEEEWRQKLEDQEEE